jgi:hypothetical protein
MLFVLWSLFLLLLKMKLLIALLLFTCISVSAQRTTTPYGLIEFRNIEQVEYCIPLPLGDYQPNSSTERGKLVFINKKNKKYQMTVQGLFRSDTTVSIVTYFANSYTSKDEEEGKIIEDKEVIAANNCFYAYGYWNNEINSSKFIEITWLRKDDVVKFTVTYSIKDAELWHQRLADMTMYNSLCQ